MKKITIWILVGVSLVVLATATVVYLVYGRDGENLQNEVSQKISAEEAAPVSEVSDETFTNSDGQEWRIPETVEFSVSSGQTDEMKFWSGKIDPLKVFPGDTQNMTIVVSSKTAIVSVQADIETDNGRQLVNLSLTGKEEENEISKEVWEGSWLVNDTSVRDYETIFTATDSVGNKKELVLAWSDPCELADGKELPYSGNNTIAYNCTISSTYGLDEGNLTIPLGVQVTVLGSSESPATLAFNPGKSLTLQGEINIGNYAQMKKTYLWVKDADGDGYTTSLLSDRVFSDSPTTPPIAGYRRQKDMVNTYSGNLLMTDCYDSNANAKPGQANWWSSASGGSPVGDYDCSGTTEYAWAQNLGYASYTSEQTVASFTSVPSHICNASIYDFHATACGTTLTTGSKFYIDGADVYCASAYAAGDLRYWTQDAVISVCK